MDIVTLPRVLSLRLAAASAQLPLVKSAGEGIDRVRLRSQWLQRFTHYAHHTNVYHGRVSTGLKTKGRKERDAVQGEGVFARNKLGSGIDMHMYVCVLP